MMIKGAIEMAGMVVALVAVALNAQAVPAAAGTCAPVQHLFSMPGLYQMADLSVLGTDQC